MCRKKKALWIGAVCMACLPGIQALAQQSTEPDTAGAKHSENYASENYGYLPSEDSDDSAYSASRPYTDNVGSRPYVPTYDSQGDYRQPTSMVFVDADSALITTKQTGQIFELRLPNEARREYETRIVLENAAFRWGEVIRLSNQLVAIAEESQSQVVLLGRDASGWQIVCRLPAPGSPNALAWDEPSGVLLATGKWSQRVYRWKHVAEAQADHSALSTGITMVNADQWMPREQVDLPMCGGRLLVLPKHQLILVVDAFGRDYAMLDQNDLSIRQTEKLYGHNVTDLCAVEDESFVLFPHQLLSEYARSVQTDITWGGLMSNNLRWLRIERMLHERGHEIFKQGRFYPLGSPGNGAGDPSSLAVSSKGRLAVTLSGTNRVAIGTDGDHYFRQVDVGLRPVDCAFTPDESSLLVVNQFSDSISAVNLEDYQVQHLTLGALRQPSQVERGEQLFFSSRLSHDGWMSCHSCHSQGHTNGQLNDNFTDKSFGTPKRVLSLLGQAETTPYSWGGSMPTLAAQVRHSIVSTMAGNAPSDRAVEAIAAFVQQLPQPPNLVAARRELGTSTSKSETRELAAGQALFRKLSCAECHAGDWFTSQETFDVAMHDENSMTHFNPPSLVSASQRQNSLFHDARAKSFRDVLIQEKHQLSSALSEPEVRALIRYLESL